MKRSTQRRFEKALAEGEKLLEVQKKIYEALKPLPDLTALRVLRAVAILKGFTLVVLLLVAPAGADVLDGLVVGAAVADVGVTELVLAKHPHGMREANPLMQSTGARVVGKAAATTLVLVGSHKLEQSGRRGWAKAFKILAVVAWGGAVALAISEERRVPR